MPPPSAVSAESPPPAPRRLLRAASIIMVAFVVSRVLGLVREAVIGARFGAMDEYGAYLAAFRMPDLLFNLIAGGALGSAFLPTFTEFLTREDRAGGWRLASAVANWLIVSLGIIAGVMALIAPWLVSHIIAPGFSPELTALTASLMRFMLVSTIIFSLSGLVMSILNAFDHFLMPAIAPVMYNLGILFGALFLAPRLGIYGLAYGVVLGAAAHALVQFPVLRRYGLRYLPTFALRDPRLRLSVAKVGRLMAPRMVGAAVVQLMFLANTIIASFYDPSVLAALNYAWILMLLPHGVFASSVATAIFPTFSRMAALNDRAGMRDGLAQTLRALLYVTLPAAVGLTILRVPIIQLLFERGVFSADTTRAVAWALLFYAPGLVGHSLVEIINRAFFALQDTLTPVIVGVLAMAANIGLSLALIPLVSTPGDLAHGPQGALALANTLASSTETVVLLLLLRRRLGGVGGHALRGGFARMALAAGVMGGALWLLLQALAGWPTLLSTPLIIALGGGLYLALTWLLGVDEARLLPRLLRRR